MAAEIRPYGPRDFATLYRIDQACFPPGIAYSKMTLRWFLTLAGAECLVAEGDGKIAGFVLAELNVPLAHVITLDVLESFRRQRIGAALLGALEANLALRGARTIVLETAIDNEAGIAFWKAHGYRIEAVLKRYYLGRLDAYAMRKFLAGHATKET